MVVGKGLNSWNQALGERGVCFRERRLESAVRAAASPCSTRQAQRCKHTAAAAAGRTRQLERQLQVERGLLLVAGAGLGWEARGWVGQAGSYRSVTTAIQHISPPPPPKTSEHTIGHSLQRSAHGGWVLLGLAGSCCWLPCDWRPALLGPTCTTALLSRERQWDASMARTLS